MDVQILQPHAEKFGRAHLGEHDMIRTVDPNGKGLVRCRKCSGCVRF